MADAEGTAAPRGPAARSSVVCFDGVSQTGVFPHKLGGEHVINTSCFDGRTRVQGPPGIGSITTCAHKSCPQVFEFTRSLVYSTFIRTTVSLLPAKGCNMFMSSMCTKCWLVLASFERHQIMQVACRAFLDKGSATPLENPHLRGISDGNYSKTMGRHKHRTNA